jgi:hypothetical protein
MEKEYTINGRKWWLADGKTIDIPKHTLWHANYWCSDGDGVELYIDRDNEGFSLHCFSGIPASEINIDSVDFGVFQDKCGLDHRTPFELQCCKIADYLCRTLELEYKEF